MSSLSAIRGYVHACVYVLECSSPDWRGWKPTLTVESMMDIPDIQAAVKAERVSEIHS